ncbi:glycosyltransferase [Methylobacterium nodulans]|uniref:Glycosyl transferase group 1 n=1 Tax=Methylobacterium nodulans (strain LMG 21967 / CNCM I-2342 / ORS 2060) TaxID=460265 RepID=B8IAD1_METNO|nr:glycosyltransferase [Methylobacterium nodulans]ACL59194.1 glycosyl transferase group 1 [Methylobacterium nodulans ORS 2060]
MRVLIADFDFFSALGGGQTFYRRMVERHPSWTCLYPSRGPDLKAEFRCHLPTNAHPFGFDRFWYPVDLLDALQLESGEERHFAMLLAQIAVPLQGQLLDLVEVPSFFPVCHLVRPIFSAFGIVVRRISLGMVGWVSVSNRNAYASETGAEVVARLEAIERRCIAAADASYTISNLHAAENMGTVPSGIVEMHDALDALPPPDPAPPGAGPPDLWCVGRLDRNKGPDLFIEMVARIPRHLYGKCYLCGPDNTWATSGPRWSETLLALARERSVDVQYLGEIPIGDLWSRAYRGRSVVVIPSRSDAFNYVAVEALTAGCPIVLTDRAGAAEFLREHHPEIAPPIMSPDDLDDAVEKLRTILEDYEGATGRLRAALLEKPWPRPRDNFLADLLAAAPASSPTVDAGQVERMRALSPLDQAPARIWRTLPPRAPTSSVDVVVRATRGGRSLALTLLSLRGGSAPLGVIVVNDDIVARSEIAAAVKSYYPAARLITQGGDAAVAFARGLAAASGDYVCFLNEGECLDTEAILRLRARLDAEPMAVAALGEWWQVDETGRPILENPGRAADHRTLAADPAGSLGPGHLLRRAAMPPLDTSLGTLVLADLWGRLARTGSVLVDATRTAWCWRDGGSIRTAVDDETYAAFLRKMVLTIPVSGGVCP